MHPIEAVIFDGDGVVFDSEDLSLAAFRQMMAHHGLRFSREDCSPFIGVGTRHILEYLRREKGLDLDLTEYEASREELYESIAAAEGGVQPMPGIGALLDLLEAAGLPWAMATSASPRKLAFNLNSTNLSERFPVSITGCQVPRGKPAPDIFLAAAARLGVEPAKCLVVEDSLNGLAAARAAGMAAIAIAGSHPDAELLELAAGVFATPGDLAAWLTVQPWMKSLLSHS